MYSVVSGVLKKQLRSLRSAVSPNVSTPSLSVSWGRKRGIDFTNTTLETWKRFIPEELYEIKGKPAEIIIGNRVKILTGGLDNGDVVNKFNSAEFAFFFIDQAEEVDAAQIGELRATFRLILNGVKIPGKGLFTANPAASFLKDEFILNPTDDRLFIQALPTDNHYLGPEYIEVLKDSLRTDRNY